VGEAKRFIAYEIIKTLKKKGEVEMLNTPQQGVQLKDESRGKLHEAWEDSFDSKEYRNEKFVMQKLQYIHANPCAGKWNLADDPSHYIHRSVFYYISGRVGVYAIKDCTN